MGTPCTTDEELELYYQEKIRCSPVKPEEEEKALEKWNHPDLPECQELTEDEVSKIDWGIPDLDFEEEEKVHEDDSEFRWAEVSDEKDLVKKEAKKDEDLEAKVEKIGTERSKIDLNKKESV